MDQTKLKQLIDNLHAIEHELFVLQSLVERHITDIKEQLIPIYAEIQEQCKHEWDLEYSREPCGHTSYVCHNCGGYK